MPRCGRISDDASRMAPRMLKQKILNGEQTAVDILDSVIDVTAHADRDMLNIGLLNTLFELIKPRSICCLELIEKRDGADVYRRYRVDGQGLEKSDSSTEAAYFPLDRDPGLARCVETAERFEETRNSDELRLVYPVLDAKGTVTGFFEVATAHFDEAERYLMSAMLKLFHNYLHLLDESEKDTLTGLLNRRTFDRNLSKMLVEESVSDDSVVDEESDQPRRRSGKQYSQNWLAVIDVDHFKKINDNYGHLYGDEVLLLLAGLMRQTFRAYDKLFRFGGEEFVVVLKKADDVGVLSALQRFRRSVEDFNFPQVGRVTISMGYIEIKPTDLPTELISRADEALYYAKENGRNQVHGYRELVAAGVVAQAQTQVNDDIELF